MRLTLAKAKEFLAKKAPNDELNYRLNRICERFLLNGKFMGTMSRLKIAAPFGQLTLPRGYRTAEGVKVNGRVFELANRWWSFLPGKSNTMGSVLMTVDDLGDGHAIMTVPTRLPTAPIADPTVNIPDFPPGSGTITVVFAGTGTPTIHMEGRDANEMPIVLNFSGAGSQTNPFACISLIRKPQTDAPVLITYTAPNDANYGGAVNNLAIMEPTEEESYYRRYFIPTLAQQPTVAVEAFCKRRHIEFTRDTDILPFTNITALGLGLDAYNLEVAGDKTAANQFWEDGVAVLNSELGDANAEDQIPSIRFHYPGRTKPNLRTHY
jgi:hypothetical protein